MTTHPSFMPNSMPTPRPTERAAALLVTRDAELAAAVREINHHVDSMTYEPEGTGPGADRGRGRTDRAGPQPCAGPGGGTKARALLVTPNLDDAQVWRRAVDWNASHVVILPDGATFLGSYLARHLAD